LGLFLKKVLFCGSLIGKSLFHIQKPAVFEYEKVDLSDS